MKKKLISVLCIILILAFQLQGMAFAQNNSSKPIPSDGDGTGLKAEYYDNMDFTDLKQTKVDENVNFNWGTSSPEKSIDSDTYSIRWTGYVLPRYTQSYTFYTASDDGVRLWVDGKLIIDEWNDHSEKESKGKIQLTAGHKYDIKLEYYENKGYSSVKLCWSSDSLKKEIIPSTQLYPQNISGIPSNFAIEATETQIKLSWDSFDNIMGYDIELDGLSTIINSDTKPSYTFTDLKPNTSHTFRVRTRSKSGVSDWSQIITKTTLMGPGNGTGLKAEYFDESDFTKIKLTRTDSQINFNWGANAPDASVSPETFSVRWSGYVQPRFGETYTFYTVSDDGVRLWVNGQLIIDDWKDHSAKESKGTIKLVAGEKYDIKLEYYENRGVSSVKLMWSSDSVKKEIIPQSQLYPAASTDIPTNFATSAKENEITVNWDSFADTSGYDVELDGNIIVDNGRSNTYTYTNLKPNSSHTFRVRTRNQLGNSDWSAIISKTTLMGPGNGTGLKGEYFDNIDFTKLKLTRTDAQVNYNWSTASPDSSIGADTFSVRWAGYVQPRYSEAYTFYTVSDDGVRLWINGQLIIEDWKDHSSKENKATISLEAGKKYEIKLEYYENKGNADVKLMWSSSSVKKEVIPQSQLYAVFAPDAPSSVGITTDSKSVMLSWEVVTGAIGYDIEADGKIIENIIGNSFADKNLEPGTKHTYRIRSRNADLTGDWSKPENAYTLYAPIESVSAKEETDSSILASWNAAPWATGYEIEVDGKVIDNGKETTFYHKDLEPNSEHVYRVRAKDENTYSEWSMPVKAKPVETGNGTGLIGEYFDEPELTHLVMSRIDSNIDFEWGLGSPDAAIPQDFFSTRWTGYVQPKYSEEYTFSTFSDDGIRVWIDGKLVINNWPCMSNDASGSITLEAGKKYEIKVEYNEYYVLATAKLMWSSKTQEKQIVPQSQLYPAAPAAPKKLVANAVSESSILINWEEVKWATGYDLEVDGNVIEMGTEKVYLHDGLAPNQPHTYRVRAKNSDIAGEWSTIVGCSPVIVGNGTGLTADYFADGEFKDLKVTRLDSNVDFDWGLGSPDAAIPQDFFSARWSGYVQPKYSEEYTFHTYSDDGVRVWVNGKLVIDNTPCVSNYFSGSIMLEAGKKYEIKVEYYETYVNAIMKLMWSSKSQAEEVIPQNCLYPVTVAIPTNIKAEAVSETSINITWNAVKLATGYDIEVDGEIVDTGTSTSYTHSGLEKNKSHIYRVRAKNESGTGDWSTSIMGTPVQTGEGTGLSAEYYADGELKDLKVARLDGNIDFDWGLGSPDPAIPQDFFSARWSGYVQPKYSEEYTFHTYSDDAVRVWVDGKLIIDNWPCVNNDASGSIVLEAGKKYEIKVEYSETYVLAIMKLMWSSKSQAEEIIPQSQLFPAVPGTPQNVQAFVSTASSIRFMWDKVNGATGYDIEVDGNLIENVSSTYYTHERIELNKSHSYRVRARNISGTSEWSGMISPISNGVLYVEAEASSSDLSKIVLYFDQYVDLQSASDINNYVIDNGVGNPISAEREDSIDKSVVVLTVNGLSDGQTYNITINNVLNINGVSMPNPITIQVTFVVE